MSFVASDTCLTSTDGGTGVGEGVGEGVGVGSMTGSFGLTSDVWMRKIWPLVGGAAPPDELPLVRKAKPLVPQRVRLLGAPTTFGTTSDPIGKKVLRS